jgi:hypothetical protein
VAKGGHVCKRPFANTLLNRKSAPNTLGGAEPQPKARKTAAAGRLIGYARVSTEDQGTDPQCDVHVLR